MDDELAYLPILKRVGVVLIIVGMLDIGQMIYCIVHGIYYSSSLNIFALIAGIFLLRGSLRAARIVLSFAMFNLTLFGCLFVAWPLLVPPGLVLTAVRLYPLWSLISFVFVTALLGLSFWVVRKLRSEPVLAARIRSGHKIPSVRAAFLTSMTLVSILGLLSIFTSNSEKGLRAKRSAAAQVGPGYRYQVTSMSVVILNGVTEVSAIVTAWNNRQIRRIPVHCSEQ
jgi:hypothetical protein